MCAPERAAGVDLAAAGPQMHALITELFPICRSITGEGIRQTLARLGREIPLEIRDVPSGTQVFDWTVPEEWNIREAWIASTGGRRLVDLRNSSLHVLNYSVPVRGRMSRQELAAHLFTLPGHPDWIPYRTSYYKRDWGFCLSHNQLLSLTEDEYDVLIDSTLEPGRLSYGELLLAGATEDEVLISAHACHPSLANDNLSGVAVALHLAKYLAGIKRRYSYRFLFLPGTIGAIAWLAQNRERAYRIRHGLVLSCVGDAGGFHYKKSRRSAAEIDRVMAQVLRHCGEPHTIEEFTPYGYDERQYCSPGFNLAVGSFSRTPYERFPEYHTSADNLDFVRPEALAGSLGVLIEAVQALENNFAYSNQQPFCEPQLGKRNLYRSTGGTGIGIDNLAKLWILNLSDGGHTLLDIAERSGIPLPVLQDSAAALAECALIVPLAPVPAPKA
jgi:aminopeptidase-like protein